MLGLNTEHVLIFVIAVFVLYMIGCRCSCNGNGFRVGGQALELREDGTYWDVDKQINPDIRFREQCCGPNGLSVPGEHALSIKVAQCLQFASAMKQSAMRSDGIPEATERLDNARPVQSGSPFYNIAAYHEAATALDDYCST